MIATSRTLLSVITGLGWAAIAWAVGATANTATVVFVAVALLAWLAVGIVQTVPEEVG